MISYSLKNTYFIEYGKISYILLKNARIQCLKILDYNTIIYIVHSLFMYL